MADNRPSLPFAGKEGMFFELEKFGSLNTQAARQSIEENEFAWIENMMPIGDGNLRALYSNGSSIYTTTAGTTVIYKFFYNIGSNNYVAVFQSDGSAVQVNLATLGITTIGTAGTFYNGTSLPAASQFGNSGLVIVGVVSGNDYWAWDGTTLYAAGSASPSWLNGGSATTMPSGLQGTAIETYQSRVWIANGPVVSFSGPSNGASFSGSTGGGSFTSSDSFLRSKFTAIRQSNGFLYLFGDSSINVISNVQTSGSPLATTFNNQNIDPEVGTPWPNTVQAFGRGLVFANQSGVFALYGGSAEKISDDLDGIFAAGQNQLGPSLNPTQQPSAAKMLLYSIRVYMILLPVPANFPLSSGGAFNSGFSSGFGGSIAATGYRNVVAIWTGKKWFLGSQVSTVNYIAPQEINSILSAYGTDGTTVFPLFTTASSSLKKTIQTKLWSGDGWPIIKQAMRAYLQANDNSGSGYSIAGTIDFQNSSDTPAAGQTTAAVSFTSSTFAIVWIGAGSVVFQFTGAGGLPLNFTSAGETISGLNANNTGCQIGATLQSTSPDFTVIAFVILYRNISPMGA